MIFISGASSGFGALTAKALSAAGHTVYAGMRDLKGESSKAAHEAEEYSKSTLGEIVPVELDVTADKSVNAAIARVKHDKGKLDVVIHNAGHMTFGPLEAFTPEQLQFYHYQRRNRSC